jgi:hypothetical protein
MSHAYIASHATLKLTSDLMNVASLHVPSEEHPLIRGFYELRGEAEEWAAIAPEADA